MLEDPTEKHISDVGILNKYDHYVWLCMHLKSLAGH